MDNQLLKYSAKDHFFKAALCHLCVDLLNGQQAVQKYTEMFPQFADARECKLVKVKVKFHYLVSQTFLSCTVKHCYIVQSNLVILYSQTLLSCTVKRCYLVQSNLLILYSQTFLSCTVKTSYLVQSNIVIL
jgi:hypothetical protein